MDTYCVQVKGVDTVIFAPDLIKYAFIGVSLSDAKFIGGEYWIESRNEIYSTNDLLTIDKMHSSNYWYLRHFLTPKNSMS